MSIRSQGPLAASLNRRRLLGAAGAGAAAAGLAGYRGFGPRRANAQDPAKLTYWQPGGSVTFCDLHVTLAEDYTAVNPAVEFESVQCGTGDGFTEQFLAAIASGTPPDLSIVWDTPVSYGARGSLMALDDMMAASQYSAAGNWPEGLLQSCQYNGQTFGLPVTAGVYGIWYNKELFEEKGIPSARDQFPKTWDELRALSKEFTQWDGDRLVSAGFVPAPPSFELHITMPVWAALNGSQLYDAANNVYTIDSEANVATLQYFVDWLAEEYKGDVGLITRSASWNAYAGPDGEPAQFPLGNLAAVEHGSWVMGDLYADGDPVFEAWDVAPYPVGPGGTAPVSGYYPNWIVLPNGSPNPEAAFGFLDYIGGVGVEKWFKTVPDLPTNLLAPDVLPDIVVEKRGEEFATDIMAFWDAQAAITTAMWNSPIQTFATDQLQLAVERAVKNEATPQQALTDIQATCQAELESFLASAGA